ncbi:TadE family type IV pilus minor pilin [Pedococcus sp. KACC 23699]|uniref:TadE family type IV pilus minor pilin n=1 Tax=Pedococcus sp. KACC 23699 TaxID=3149228 RepID=A0AAU7JPH6_9MICO
MATVELAVALPALVLVLVVALSGITTVLDQVRCVDAARATARAMARGDATAGAVDQGRRLAPPAAQFAVSTTASAVDVTVSSPAAPALRWLGARAAPRGHASANREDVPAAQGDAGAAAGAGAVPARTTSW